MSKIVVTIEACVNGTITRANARALNRATLAMRRAHTPGVTPFTGRDEVADVCEILGYLGVECRVVAAASLTGADKARHTREVNRSRNAQARRTERKAEAAFAA